MYFTSGEDFWCLSGWNFSMHFLYYRRTDELSISYAGETGLQFAPSHITSWIVANRVRTLFFYMLRDSHASHFEPRALQSNVIRSLAAFWSSWNLFSVRWRASFYYWRILSSFSLLSSSLVSPRIGLSEIILCFGACWAGFVGFILVRGALSKTGAAKSGITA